MNKPLHTLSLVEVCRALQTRQLTSLSYTEALLERVALLEPSIGAWAWIEPAAALEAARRCDRRRLAEGGLPGALQGVPIGVKDIFATAGVPTEMGSPAFAGHCPEQSARLVERIEARGAFVMGKTVATECAFLSPGKTHNPWNPLHTPGGSSSGSAAAVAAGFTPAAVGTQTNGSVIRPAAYCGVVGFKPTQGMLPIEGALTFSHTLDQTGVFTHRVADAAWFTSALAEANRPLPPEIPPPSAPPAFAAVRTPVWDEAEAAAKAHFQDRLRTLQAAGARVEDLELPPLFALGHRAIRTIMAVEAAAHLGELEHRAGSLLSATLRDFLAEGRALGDADYREALEVRGRLQESLTGILAHCDALLTPPTTGEAPASLETTGSPIFCSLWSLCGVPAVTIPTGLGPRGLPLGLQIVGSQGQDGRLLAAAEWCEARFSFSPLR